MPWNGLYEQFKFIGFPNVLHILYDFFIAEARDAGSC
jgi:hypothetical protein